MKSLEERLWNLVSPEPMSGCWLWIGAERNGYGNFFYKRLNGDRSTNGMRYAHIVSHEIFKGPIPAGLEIDHKCRTPFCVNPNHLEAVTPQVNVRRGIGPDLTAQRYALRTHCINGHDLSTNRMQKKVSKKYGGVLI